MENKKNSSNTVFYVVLCLCIAAIVGVTVFTSSMRREKDNVDNAKKFENVTVTESTGQVKPKETKKQSSEAASSSVSETTRETMAEATEAKTERVTEATTAPQESTPTAVEEKETFILPVSGYIASEFEIDIPVFSQTMNDYRAHTGVDIACEEGSAVGSCAAGVVKVVKNDPLMGTTVGIEHADGVCSYYMNLNETLPEEIKVGTPVEKGQLVGAVGNTALIEVAAEPHLHFEMTVSGAYVDPISMMSDADVAVMSDSFTE